MTLTKAILEQIEKCYSFGERTVVYTQDIELIKSFLDSVPGRWRVAVNQEYWDINDLMTRYGCRGPLTSGMKYSMNGMGHEQAEIGIDVIQPGSRLIFSKSPGRAINGGRFYLLDDFSLPNMHIRQSLPPIMAVQKLGRSVCFFADSLDEYNTMHDHFAIQDIKHTLVGGAGGEVIGVFRKPEYVKAYDNAVCYGYSSLRSIFTLNEFKDLYLVAPDSVAQYCDFETCSTVINCLKDAFSMAYSEEFISYMTGIHQRNVPRVMQFMVFYGWVGVGTRDAHQVVISKTGAQPKDDPHFAAIPQGRYLIGELAGKMGCDRLQVMDILKLYEGKGLVFSYTQNPFSKVYTYAMDIDRRAHEAAMLGFSNIEQFIVGLKESGNEYLRKSLEAKLVEDCRTNKAQGFLFKNGKIDSEVNLA